MQHSGLFLGKTFYILAQVTDSFTSNQIHISCISNKFRPHLHSTLNKSAITKMLNNKSDQSNSKASQIYCYGLSGKLRITCPTGYI